MKKPINLKGITPESMYIRYREPLKDYYKFDYNQMWKECFFEADSFEAQIAWLRDMFCNDLFFMLYYGLKRSDVNSFDMPFILQACRIIENGPPTDTVDLWARGHYKLLSDDTPILTSCGWSTHGEIKPGDFVFSPNGNPVKVLATTRKQYDPEMYDISFSDHNGERSYKICAGSQHLWDVEFFDRRRITNTDKRIGWTKKTLSTKDLINRTIEQQDSKNPRWYRVKRTMPLHFEHKNLPIEPYTYRKNPNGRKGSNYDYWYIKDIVRTKTVPGQCIQVEGGKYLAGENLIPTHNSSIITQAKSLQDMFKYDDLSIGIFSHTRPIAKGFLIPIKTALEDNILLKLAFYDKLWENPKKDAKVWSLDEGLELKRKSTSNTRSFEAWGLVDGMPISKHYNIRIYDDVITDKTANNPEMIKKADDAFRLSDNLGTLSGINWQRIIGTIYNHGDFYCTVIDEAKNGTYGWNLRKFVWYEGYYTEEDIARLGIPQEYVDIFGYRKPRLLSWEQALSKRKKQLNYIWSCQMELSPTTDEASEFKLEWLKKYRTLPDPLSLYIFVDPANEKKKTSDYTVVALVGIDQFGNRFLVDIIRDRLDLGERWGAIKKMVISYPNVMGVFYEKYGKDSDIWYMEQRQMEEGKYFTIDKIGGGTTKADRIRRFIPICREGKFYLPEKPIVYHGQDLVRIFIDEEYTKFPFCRHDDMLDAISRIEDPDVALSKPIQENSIYKDANLLEEYYEQISCDEAI